MPDLGFVEAKDDSVTRFDMIARGQFWGQGPYTPGAPKGTFPLAISFTLGGKKARCTTWCRTPCVASRTTRTEPRPIPPPRRTAPTHSQGSRRLVPVRAQDRKPRAGSESRDFFLALGCPSRTSVPTCQSPHDQKAFAPRGECG